MFLLLKAHLAKGSHTANKADKLSKSVDEIAWKDAIQTGKIDKMSVSKLDLHLEKAAGFQNKALHAKGLQSHQRFMRIKNTFIATKTLQHNILQDHIL